MARQTFPGTCKKSQSGSDGARRWGSDLGEDRPIESGFSDAEQEHRYRKIEGVARVRCGGFHLRRTGEVGRITLKRKYIGRGRERIEISVGA